ncbi:MAG: RDD family protein [Clostridium sp.]|uniref:RDD family protein n=1 Tax=Clostridium sp. TaxID=1506 RepID=UPI0025BC66F6|nr:RDD family protein [Clostridium sp.]MCE5222142.1 RDD family protein [Clostridium sp.]
MGKDNIKENEIKSEVEETEVQTSNMESTETQTNSENQNIMEGNTNVEIEKLINDENNDKDEKENSCTKLILATILDQTLLVAASAVLVLLCDMVLRLFGYMFVKGTGATVLAGGIIYFILNCIYAPIMEKSKAKNTIAKKILNIN